MEFLRRGVIAGCGFGNRKVRKRRRQFEMMNRRQHENILADQVQPIHGAFSVSHFQVCKPEGVTGNGRLHGVWPNGGPPIDCPPNPLDRLH